MEIIKVNGEKLVFDNDKIKTAVEKALDKDFLTPIEIRNLLTHLDYGRLLEPVNLLDLMKENKPTNYSFIGLTRYERIRLLLLSKARPILINFNNFIGGTKSEQLEEIKTYRLVI